MENIANRRLWNQHVDGSRLKSPAEVVAHLGAMQAQDFPMVKWALGVRLPGMTDDKIMQSFNNGEIIRTHLLRPTWHLVVPEDIHSLLHLTAPRILSGMRSRHRELELDESMIIACEEIFIKALRGNQHKTREELMKILELQGITADSARASHLMFCAELHGIVCSGEIRGKQQTYALLDERVPRRNNINADKALEKLARQYLTGHGPATAADFSWWSGLSLSMVRKGIEMIRKELRVESDGSAEYWSIAAEPENVVTPSVHLLPAFDEFLISYTDRSAALESVHHPRAVSSNGIFRPILVINGQIEGIWKRTIKGKDLHIEISVFSPVKKKMMPLLKEASTKYANYLNMKFKMSVG